MSSNYVKMGDGSVKPGTSTNEIEIPGLDNPSLSLEEKDLRLALALQQQENASAYEAHKKKIEAKHSSQNNRTSRSSAGTRLTAARLNQKGAKDAAIGGGSYAGPDDSSDARLASELYKVGVTTAKTASVIAEGGNDAKTAKMRNGRSVF